jgi:hypothetical protein
MNTFLIFDPDTGAGVDLRFLIRQAEPAPNQLRILDFGLRNLKTRTRKRRQAAKIAEVCPASTRVVPAGPALSRIEFFLGLRGTAHEKVGGFGGTPKRTRETRVLPPEAVLSGGYNTIHLRRACAFAKASAARVGATR